MAVDNSTDRRRPCQCLPGMCAAGLVGNGLPLRVWCRKNPLPLEHQPYGDCYNCNGQGMVFPGFEGRPLIGPDTSRIITCPVCNGTGKVRGGQMPLF